MTAKPTINVSFSLDAITKLETKEGNQPYIAELCQIAVDGRKVIGAPAETADSAIIITNLAVSAFTLLAVNHRDFTMNATIAIEKPEKRGSDDFYTAVYGGSLSVELNSEVLDFES